MVLRPHAYCYIWSGIASESSTRIRFKEMVSVLNSGASDCPFQHSMIRHDLARSPDILTNASWVPAHDDYGGHAKKPSSIGPLWSDLLHSGWVLFWFSMCVLWRIKTGRGLEADGNGGVGRTRTDGRAEIRRWPTSMVRGVTYSCPERHTCDFHLLRRPFPVLAFVNATEWVW